MKSRPGCSFTSKTGAVRAGSNRIMNAFFSNSRNSSLPPIFIVHRGRPFDETSSSRQRVGPVSYGEKDNAATVFATDGRDRTNPPNRQTLTRASRIVRKLYLSGGSRQELNPAFSDSRTHH